MELTQEQIERRAEGVVSGSYRPDVPGLDVLFIRMTLSDRGASSRAYSAKLKELFDAGGYFSEFALPNVLRKVCQDNHLDLDALQRKRAIQERLFRSIPPDLQGPYDSLTDEEVAELPAEARESRQQAIAERGQRSVEWLAHFYADADREVLAEAEQIEQLENHIRSHTAEHLARKHQMEMEILRCTRQAGNPEQPYFKSIEQIQNLPPAVLTPLYMKWKQFREGMTDAFFSPSSAAR